MIEDLGHIDYMDAYRIQKDFVELRKTSAIGDSLLIAEHRPVFTVGRTGRIENLLVTEDFLKEKGIAIIYTNRGGDITFHGPGQLVAYPIIDLKKRGKDIHRYLRELEYAAIDFLKRYGIMAGRQEGMTGIWVRGRKIASIGIAVTHWITYHGMSINITADLDYFSMIYPCGLKGIKTINASETAKRNISMEDAKTELIRCLRAIFSIEENEYASCAGLA